VDSSIATKDRSSLSNIPNTVEHYIAINRPNKAAVYDMSGLVTNNGVELETKGCGLVIRRDGDIAWQSNALRYDVNCRILLQNDGNVVIMTDDGTVIWSSETNAIRTLHLDADGILRGYDVSNEIVWFSHNPPYHRNKNEHEDGKGSIVPEVVWLMSFPNSGTSFTLHLVQSASKRTSATNYERETENARRGIPGTSLLQHMESNDKKSPLVGPYIISDDTVLPKKYILTKTHCAGYVIDSPIRLYTANHTEFLRGCGTVDKIGNDGNLIKIPYNHTMLPKKNRSIDS